MNVVGTYGGWQETHYDYLVTIQYKVYTNKTKPFKAEFCQCVKNCTRTVYTEFTTFYCFAVKERLRVMKVQTQQILHKMRAHKFCLDTESYLILLIIILW